MAPPVGDVEQPLRHLRKISLVEQQPAERIAPVPVEACGNQYYVRREVVYARQNSIGEGFPKSVAARAGK